MKKLNREEVCSIVATAEVIYWRFPLLSRLEAMTGLIAAGLLAREGGSVSDQWIVDKSIDLAAHILATLEDEAEREKDRTLGWKEVLEKHHGNKTLAARELGISVRTIYNRLRKEREL